MTWDVEAWKKSKEWDLQFDFVKPNSNSHGAEGTRILISSLHKPISRRFETDSFAEGLRQRLASTHALFLRAGVSISVNDISVKHRLPELAVSKDYALVRKRFSVDDVDVHLLAGLTPKADRVPRGWYIFCNGRMVLEADKTYRTGWGDLLPQFHSKYNHFVGFVFFRSRHVDRLPWTTTKEGVEQDSPIYQRALSEMALNAMPLLKFVNRFYPSDEHAEKELNRQVLDRAQSVAAEDVEKAESSFRFTPPKRKSPREATISFRKPAVQVEKVKKHLGDLTMSNGKVGEYVFDWFMKEELKS